MITKLLTEQVMFQITENMINNGGSFAKAQAQAYRLADPNNQDILRIALANLFQKYNDEY